MVASRSSAGASSFLSDLLPPGVAGRSSRSSPEDLLALLRARLKLRGVSPSASGTRDHGMFCDLIEELEPLTLLKKCVKPELGKLLQGLAPQQLQLLAMQGPSSQTTMPCGLLRMTIPPPNMLIVMLIFL